MKIQAKIDANRQELMRESKEKIQAYEERQRRVRQETAFAQAKLNAEVDAQMKAEAEAKAAQQLQQ